ncbi:hypothetical protein AVEN_136861-1 [Araneus ventricosus]|uniref:Uncharacterized protein n=1 Tax=Araneus ventricosus TaxID=182803 RepID=A0A4Y2U6E2_ARAVE|nr:hypothetical protein AVEN_136861-1 [Araneus ventricosus]
MTLAIKKLGISDLAILDCCRMLNGRKTRGSPSLGEYVCPNPEVPRDLYSLPVYPPLCLLLIPSIPRRQARELSMRSCCHSVCFLLLMDSQKSHVLAVRGDPFDGWCTVGAPVYQFDWYPNRLVGLLGIKRKGHSLGLGAKGGQRSWR